MAFEELFTEDQVLDDLTESLEVGPATLLGEGSKRRDEPLQGVLHQRLVAHDSPADTGVSTTP